MDNLRSENNINVVSTDLRGQDLMQFLRENPNTTQTGLYTQLLLFERLSNVSSFAVIDWSSASFGIFDVVGIPPNSSSPYSTYPSAHVSPGPSEPTHFFNYTIIYNTTYVPQYTILGSPNNWYSRYVLLALVLLRPQSGT